MSLPVGNGDYATPSALFVRRGVASSRVTYQRVIKNALIILC
jgi:hypothetical protein